MKPILLSVTLLCVLLASCSPAPPDNLKALIVDGQNNHAVWPKGTIMMRQYLLDTGLFSQVDVAHL